MEARTVSFALYCIDGLGEPPGSWYALGHKLRELLGVPVWFFDHENPQIIRQMRAELPGTKIIAVGHSFGAFKVSELSQQIPLHAAVLIDCVRRNWWYWPFTAKRPVGCFASHNASFRKLSGLPPAVSIIGGENYLTGGDHNSVIVRATPHVVEWVRGVISA